MQALAQPLHLFQGRQARPAARPRRRLHRGVLVEPAAPAAAAAAGGTAAAPAAPTSSSAAAPALAWLWGGISHLFGCSEQAKERSYKAKLVLAAIINEMVCNSNGDTRVKVQQAAFGCVPGQDWRNKEVLTRPLPLLDDMKPHQLLTILSQAGVGVVRELQLSANTLEPAGGWRAVRERMTPHNWQAREFWRQLMCSAIINVYMRAQATLGLRRLMLLTCVTIDRQAEKFASAIKTTGPDGYQQLLPHDCLEMLRYMELECEILKSAVLLHSYVCGDDCARRAGL